MRIAWNRLVSLVIRHFHGRSHVRHDAPGKLWCPHFTEAREAGAGGLNEWAGRYDLAVQKFLPGALRKCSGG